MNSKIKGIIVGAVVLGCLGTTLAVLELTGKPADSSSSDISSTASDLADETYTSLTVYKKESISRIRFENEYGELNVERVSTGENASWTLAELDGINQNATAVKACVNVCSEIKAKQLVEENASDLAKYGLEQPASKITISADGFDDVTFLLGDEIPTGNYRYIVKEGSKDVYTVLMTNTNYFVKNAQYFCSLSVVYTPSQDSWPEIERLTIKRKDLDYDMVFVTIPEDEAPIGMVSTQAMISPVYSGLNITSSASVTHGIWGLTATEAIVIHPTDEDFAQYGLDDPQCKVILDCDTEDYTLKIGNPVYVQSDSGEDTSEVAGYYCYINAEGSDCIYLIDKSSCSWATVLPGDIIAGQMASNYIMDLNKITLSVEGGDTTVIDINAVKEDEDNGIEEVFEISSNGKSVDGELFKDWYVFWLECPTNETYFEPLTENETLYMTVTIGRKDGTEQIVKLYQTSGRRLIAEIDGKVGYKIPISYAETLEQNLKRVINGQNIVDTY